MNSGIGKLICGGLAATGLLIGQMANKPIPKAADYYDILDLDARFCHGLDSGTADGRMFSSTFTADGVFVDADGRETKGSEQLASIARGASPAGVVNPRHYVVNIRIELVPGGARQWSYLLVTGPSQPGKPDAVIDGGQYWDDLVKSPDGWLIKKRILLKPGTARPEASAVFASDLTSSSVPSPRTGSRTASDLTANDRAQIFQLYAHYPYALDQALDGGQMFANLFTPDGIMTQSDGTSVAGRDKLAEFVWRRGLTDVKTYITNLMLEATPEGVKATAYLMNAEIPQTPAPSTIAPVGIFSDSLVKTQEGWKIKRQVLVATRGSVPQLPKETGPKRQSLSAREHEKWALTADDYAEIQQLYARYGQGYDSKVDDGSVYLSVFSKTGRFTDQFNKVVDGFENLDRTYAHSATGKPNPINLTHSTWNLAVDPAPWGAVGHSYTGGGRVNAPGSAPSPGLLGAYIDMIVRTPEGWRFERRIFRQDFPRPVGRVGGPAPPSSPSAATRP